MSARTTILEICHHGWCAVRRGKGCSACRSVLLQDFALMLSMDALEMSPVLMETCLEPESWEELQKRWRL